MARSMLSWLTASSARRVISVAKVVVPAVAPVVLPFAVKAAGAVRASWDQARARRLGIDIADLPKYSGKGGALHARIVGDAKAVVSLRDTDEEGKRFAEVCEARLAQLTAIVRAAEAMPTARRRSAHRAVTAELDRLEKEMLRLMGV